MTFNLTWHEGDGGWGNGDPKNWGGDGLTKYGNNVQGGGSGDNYANNLYYASYFYNMGVQRYAKVTLSGSNSEYALWGFSSSQYPPSVQDTTTTYYFYGNGAVSKSEPSKTGGNLLGDWYVHYREIYYVRFYSWSSPGVYKSTADKEEKAYAAVEYSAKCPSTVSYTPSGYQFAGWASSKNDFFIEYEKGSTITYRYGGVDHDISYFAVYLPKVNLYSYYTTNYSSFTNSSSGGTISISYNDGYISTTEDAIYNSYVYVSYNVQISIYCTAKTGYEFVGWYKTKPTSSNSNSPFQTSQGFYTTCSDEAPYSFYALFVRQKSLNIYNRYTTQLIMNPYLLAGLVALWLIITPTQWMMTSREH